MLPETDIFIYVYVRIILPFLLSYDLVEVKTYSQAVTKLQYQWIDE